MGEGVRFESRTRVVPPTGETEPTTPAEEAQRSGSAAPPLPRDEVVRTTGDPATEVPAPAPGASPGAPGEQQTTRQAPPTIDRELRRALETLANPLRRGDSSRAAHARALRALSKGTPGMVDAIIDMRVNGSGRLDNYWTHELDQTWKAGVEQGLISPEDQRTLDIALDIRRLGSLSDSVEERATGTLIANLRSDDPNLAAQTAEALLTTVRANEPIRSHRAMQALDEANSPASLLAIARLADDPHQHHRVSRDLRDGGVEGLQAALRAWPDVSAEGRRELWDVFSGEESWRAALDLAEQGDPTVLDGMLSATLATEGAWSVGMRKTLDTAEAPPAATQALIRLTAHGSKGTARSAYFALQRQGASAIDTVAATWDDLTPSQQALLLPLLADHPGRPGATERLAGAMAGSSPEAREAAYAQLASAQARGKLSSLPVQRTALARVALDHVQRLPVEQRRAALATAVKMLDGLDPAVQRGFYLRLQQNADAAPDAETAAAFNEAAKDTANLLGMFGQRLEDLDTAVQQGDLVAAASLMQKARPAELTLLADRLSGYGDDTQSRLRGLVAAIRNEPGAVRAGLYASVLESLYARGDDPVAADLLKQELNTDRGARLFAGKQLERLTRRKEDAELLEGMSAEHLWTALRSHAKSGGAKMSSSIRDSLATGAMGRTLGPEVMELFGSDEVGSLRGGELATFVEQVAALRGPGDIAKVNALKNDPALRDLKLSERKLIMTASMKNGDAADKLLVLARNRKFKKAHPLARAAILKRIDDRPDVATFEHVEQLVNADWFSDHTMSVERQQAYIDARQSPWAALVSENFDTWDTDDDGFLSKSEVLSAFENPRNRGRTAAALALLKIHLEDLEELSNDELFDENDGLTRADLAVFAATQDYPLGYYEGKIRNQSRQLFVGDPNPRAVRQGSHGDCWLLASIVALAEQRPQAIRDMIHEVDGGYEVRFPERTVRISAPTDAEIAMYANAGANGLWLTVLEKAYAKYANEENWFPHEDDYDETDGGRTEWSIRGLTGHSTDVDNLSLTRLETTREKLTAAVRDGRLVTASIHSYLWSPEHAKYGLANGHAYTVLGYDPATDTVTIRNPWGSGDPVNDDGRPIDGRNDGVFTLSLEEFDEIFSSITYEESD